MGSIHEVFEYPSIGHVHFLYPSFGATVFVRTGVSMFQILIDIDTYLFIIRLQNELPEVGLIVKAESIETYIFEMLNYQNKYYGLG